ncbi:MAG: M20/M25/M40 family metallo-hydrolase, partial [Clostridia bacterium]|nr:M20/M25/M40 family metallo-hydrolase [Clostridia bacterium]
QRFNSVIINAVARLGLKAEANGRNDITVEGRKFSGCAYALSGVARAMHGTVLVNTDLTRLSGYLNPSAKKLAAKGVTSVRSRVINLSELTEVSVERMRELITEEFVREFGPAEPLILDSAAQEAIGRLTEEQSSWEWMFGRSPEFDWQLDSRFSFGGVQLLVSVKNGLIASARTYTDSMEVGLPEEVSSLLTGVRFGEEEIAAALEKGGPACLEISAYIARSALIERARQRLHSIPELGLKEEKTKAFIKEFISSHTSLELHDEGAFIYAVHREGDLPALCVRADFDAVPCGDSAVHLCGHDGHTAALLGLGLMLEGASLGRTVVLLFQPAEETGRGAPLCAPLFKKENISAVIGAHNIPGRPFSVLLRPGVFACASCGLELRLTGRPTHAAYPENGVDPTEALARLALEIPEKAKSLSEEYGCMTLATVVGLRAGERAFGVAASEAALWVTLRSESAEAFSSLRAFAVSRSEELSDSHGLILSVAEEDPFPATVNDPGLYERLLSVCKKRMLPYYILEEPFRWSEDFG